MSYKKILISILARDKEATLPLYLKCIYNLDYNKKNIVLYIRTNDNADNTEQILKEFIDKHGNEYSAIEFDNSSVNDSLTRHHDWNSDRFKALGHIRNVSLNKTLEYNCDFYFVVDCDNFILPYTLNKLVALDLPIVAPFMKSDQHTLYSNYHSEVDENGYNQSCQQYTDIFSKSIVGVHEVKVVHCTYLIKADIIPKLTYDDNSYRYEYVIFSDSARKNTIPQYIDNTINYGIITFKTTNEEMIGFEEQFLNPLKPKGIFCNSKKASCSIWESGNMVYAALCKSNNYTLDYSEETSIGYNYDFYVFNQHKTVNNWMNESIVKSLKKPTFCVVTEVCHRDNPIGGIPAYFDYYMVLDPTVNERANIFAFPRPLEDYPVSEYVDEGYPVIGSFGFATPNKDWHKIVIGVQQEFDEALIRINIPQATYVPTHIQDVNAIRNLCQSHITKTGIKLEITTQFMDKAELIRWCSENTLNCFMYHRSHTHPTGMAAVTDQAISSKRPLLVSSDPTFRHIHKYIKPYPETTFKQAIDSIVEVKKMCDDWSQLNFSTKFQQILFKTK